MITGIKLLQINLNTSLPATESTLQLAIELNIHIIAVQEPWTISDSDGNYRSVIHSSFKQVLPNYGTVRPRTLFYVSNEINTSLAPDSPRDPDCIVLELLDINVTARIDSVCKPIALLTNIRQKTKMEKVRRERFLICLSRGARAFPRKVVCDKQRSSIPQVWIPRTKKGACNKCRMRTQRKVQRTIVNA